MNIFLGCTKSKLKGKQKAKDLYSASDMFRGRLAYANKLKSQSGEQNKIFILSAKYGLVGLNDELKPYDMYLADFSNSRKEKWADKVLQQISKAGISKKQKTYFLCGKDYWEDLIEYFPNSITELDLSKDKYGDSGMGYILQFYHDTVDKEMEAIKEKSQKLQECLELDTSDISQLFKFLNILEDI